MQSQNNIIVHHVKISIVDDEYAVRYRAKIKVVGLSKKDFESAARNAFARRVDSIRKYKLTLDSDGCHPEYLLSMVEAKSVDDINDALDEIDNSKEKKSAQISPTSIEKLTYSYKIEPSRAEEFKQTLEHLTELRSIEVRMWGKPRTIREQGGEEVVCFNFTLTGEARDIEEVIMELDRIF